MNNEQPRIAVILAVLLAIASLTACGHSQRTNTRLTPAPLSFDPLGIDVAPGNVATVQGSSIREVAQFLLSNNSSVPMSRLAVSGRIITNDAFVTGSVVLMADGQTIDIVDWRQDGSFSFDAGGLILANDIEITVLLLTDHGTNDMVQAVVDSVQTNTGLDLLQRVYEAILCG